MNVIDYVQNGPGQEQGGHREIFKSDTRKHKGT